MWRRKKGFSLVESLILILVVALTIGGILQVSAYTTRMQMAARKRIDSYLVATSWFAALEAVPAMSIDTHPVLSFASADKAIGAASAYIVSRDKNYQPGKGIVTVTITLAESDNKNTIISRDYNIYGNDTVPDDKGVN